MQVESGPFSEQMTIYLFIYFLLGLFSLSISLCTVSVNITMFSWTISIGPLI